MANKKLIDKFVKELDRVAQLDPDVVMFDTLFDESLLLQLPPQFVFILDESLGTIYEKLKMVKDHLTDDTLRLITDKLMTVDEAAMEENSKAKERRREALDKQIAEDSLRRQHVTQNINQVDEATYLWDKLREHYLPPTMAFIPLTGSRDDIVCALNANMAYLRSMAYLSDVVNKTLDDITDLLTGRRYGPERLTPISTDSNLYNHGITIKDTSRELIVTTAVDMEFYSGNLNLVPLNIYSSISIKHAEFSTEIVGLALDDIVNVRGKYAAIFKAVPQEGEYLTLTIPKNTVLGRIAYYI